MTTWIISDTHFGDNNLVASAQTSGKTARPFATVREMDECLADNWNDLIAPEDTVYHLGDVYTGTGAAILPRLNGHKNLIIGNHDQPWDPVLAEAFETVSLWKVLGDAKTVLTHLPIDLSECSGLGHRFHRNIHGHLHYKPAPSAAHLCVSVEQTGFKPLDLDSLIDTTLSGLGGAQVARGGGG